MHTFKIGKREFIQHTSRYLKQAETDQIITQLSQLGFKGSVAALIDKIYQFEPSLWRC